MAYSSKFNVAGRKRKKAAFFFFFFLCRSVVVVGGGDLKMKTRMKRSKCCSGVCVWQNWYQPGYGADSSCVVVVRERERERALFSNQTIWSSLYSHSLPSRCLCWSKSATSAAQKRSCVASISSWLGSSHRSTGMGSPTSEMMSERRGRGRPAVPQKKPSEARALRESCPGPEKVRSWAVPRW